jgi:nucleoid-associated protein YgaU
MNPRAGNFRVLHHMLPWCLGVLVIGSPVLSAEGGPPAEAQRRAATLADIGKLRLELGTREDNAAAVEALKEAVRLDPANIRVRFWLGTAWLRTAGLGSGKPLDVELAGRAGLDLEAVFRLAALERTAEAEDLRLRAIALLDLCVEEMPASDLRFGPWWKKRRAELLAGRNVVSLSHVAARGDTPESLAKRYYGDAGLGARIAEANPGVDFRTLAAGQRLVIPGVRVEPPAPVPAVDAADRALLRQLASAPQSAERRVAAERLAKRECLMAVPALAGALRADESQWVRAECAKSLGLIASPDAEPALAAALGNDSWPGCRLEAARALARLGGRGSLAVLQAGLDDESPQVAAASARALGALGLPEASAPLLGALGSRSEALRRSAAAALAELGRRDSLGSTQRERLPALAGKGPPAARAAAGLALARLDPAAAVPILKAGLDGDEALRRGSAEGLALAAAGGAKLDAGTVGSLLKLAAPGGDPATALGAAAARAGKGSPAGKEGLLSLAALLDEHRAVYWADADEPEPAAGIAARLLAELTGARLPADRAAWTAWLGKESGQ